MALVLVRRLEVVLGVPVMALGLGVVLGHGIVALGVLGLACMHRKVHVSQAIRD